MTRMKDKILVKFNYLYDANSMKVLGKDLLCHLDMNNQTAHCKLNKREFCIELAKLDNVDYVEESGQECNIKYTKHSGGIG